APAHRANHGAGLQNTWTSRLRTLRSANARRRAADPRREFQSGIGRHVGGAGRRHGEGAHLRADGEPDYSVRGAANAGSILERPWSASWLLPVTAFVAGTS